MKDQHTKIKGYRDLTQEEIDLMNEIKEMGVKLEQLLDKVSNSEDEPCVWWTEARLSLKKGLMFLVRAVAKPTSF